MNSDNKTCIAWSASEKIGITAKETDMTHTACQLDKIRSFGPVKDTWRVVKWAALALSSYPHSVGMDINDGISVFCFRALSDWWVTHELFSIRDIRKAARATRRQRPKGDDLFGLGNNHATWRRREATSGVGGTGKKASTGFLGEKEGFAFPHWKYWFLCLVSL